MEDKNKNRGLIGALVLALLIILFLIGYIFNDKGMIFNSNALKDEAEKEEVIDDDNDLEKDSDGVKCYGTYYVETTGNLDNGLSYDYKYTYNLNNDGTFTADFSGNSAATGKFVINDNTITFISQKHTTGPKDVDPMYSSVDYVIADDCSYILINDGSVSFKIMKNN